MDSHYKDGNEAANKWNADWGNYHATRFEIGARHSQPENQVIDHFEGSIDDVRFTKSINRKRNSNFSYRSVVGSNDSGSGDSGTGDSGNGIQEVRFGKW